MTFDLHRDLEERFLRYVQVDTESDADSTSVPSTERQLDLLRMLEVELQQLGAEDVQLTDYATLLATIPATEGGGEAPTIAFMAHVDTTEAFPGLGVEPRVHRSWDGSPIMFPKDGSLVLSPERSPDLKAKIGQDIVTASGDTLLGADDKAGVAIVMGMARSLLEKSGTEHGRIRLCFTPDEEIGRGVDHLTPGDLDARWAYTLDGGNTGEISSETFSANMAVVTFRGVSVHPGTAYHDLVNACTLAAKFHAALPEHARTPETTKDREGFIHLYEIGWQRGRSRTPLHPARLRQRSSGGTREGAVPAGRDHAGGPSARRHPLRHQGPVPQHGAVAAGGHDPGGDRPAGHARHRS